MSWSVHLLVSTHQTIKSQTDLSEQKSTLSVELTWEEMCPPMVDRKNHLCELKEPSTHEDGEVLVIHVAVFLLLSFLILQPQPMNLSKRMIYRNFHMSDFYCALNIWYTGKCDTMKMWIGLVMCWGKILGTLEGWLRRAAAKKKRDLWIKGFLNEKIEKCMNEVWKNYQKTVFLKKVWYQNVTNIWLLQVVEFGSSFHSFFFLKDSLQVGRFQKYNNKSICSLATPAFSYSWPQREKK